MLKKIVLIALALGGLAFFGSELGAQNGPKAPSTTQKRFDLAGLPSVAPIAVKSKDSVVNIVATRHSLKPPVAGGPTAPNAPGPSPQPIPMLPNNFRQVSQGSGFIYDAEGYVITNNHLVEGADEIKVTIDKDLEQKATIIGRDPKTDLALLKLTKPGPYAFLGLGDSDGVEIGDWLVAIGNPFGLEHTVTLGILSARGRSIGAGPYDDFLQTDASINPGSSGGPLVSLSGEVVGVNARITSRGAGIGFAIPSKLVAKIVAQLREKGYVERGWFGVGFQPLTREMAKAFGLEEAKGALVSDVFPDTPASLGGVKHGDIVVGFDGRPVRENNDLSGLVADTPPGKTVKVEVIRDRKKTELLVTIARLEDESTLTLAAGGALDLGLTLKPISAEIAKEMNAPKGLIVESVDPNSPALLGGVVPRDIILEIDRQPMSAMEDYLKAIHAHKSGPILLFVKRGERTIYLAISPKEE
ncbi:MAG: trypsin-like peptidase domain-containing protein [Deltaproteobacteria bacterium]|nr:trypsin-like peptidase domain-containing protein [Deltaproteobacteria bacterium]